MALSALIIAIACCGCPRGKETTGNEEGDSSQTKDLQVENSQTEKLVNAKISFHQPVNAKMADSCIQIFQKLPRIGSSNTHYISFERSKLHKWIDSIERVTDYDNLRVVMGIYTPGILNAYHKPDSLNGRVTVFLWPYKGKQPAQKPLPLKAGQTKADSIPVDPYNMGELHP